MRYLVGMLLFAYSGSSFAIINTGQDVIKKCTSYIKYIENPSVTLTDAERTLFTECSAYFSGLVDTALFYSDIISREKSMASAACLPIRTQYQQIIIMSYKHIKDNPELLRKFASTEILSMLAAKYPCK